MADEIRKAEPCEIVSVLLAHFQDEKRVLLTIRVSDGTTRDIHIPLNNANRVRRDVQRLLNNYRSDQDEPHTGLTTFIKNMKSGL